MRIVVFMTIVAVILSGCVTSKPYVRIEYVRPKAPKSVVEACARKPKPTEPWVMQSAVKRHMDRLDYSDSDCRTRADTAQKWIRDNGLVE